MQNPETCKHECVNYGMVRDSDDSMHIYVTELCVDCLQSRAVIYRRLNLGDWMSTTEFRDHYKGQLIGSPKEAEDA